MPPTIFWHNYYKFMLDTIIDSMNRNPDTVVSNNKNAVSPAYIHFDQVDPAWDQRFTESRIDPDTGQCIKVDITEKVFYINAATGMCFVYNPSFKNDPSFGYGMRQPGWIALSGAVTK